MNLTEKETNWQTLPAIVIVLLLAVGAYWAPWPLEGERPPQFYGGVPAGAVVQQADARLWQDPFAAAYRHWRAPVAPLEIRLIEKQAREGSDLGIVGTTSARKYDPPWFQTIVQSKCASSKSCLVLGVMVFGGPYVGMEEYRRYTRYAVLAGLNRQGFVPLDAERIGYVDLADRDDLPKLVPFEWLEKKEINLLLLWLDEEALTRESSQSRGDVFDRFATLFRDLGLRVPGVDLRIIGPASSGTLANMAGTVASRERKTGTTVLPAALAQARWYSASATSNYAWDQVAKTKTFWITRIIAKDDSLTRELIRELEARGLGTRDTVVLVGQWDTAYSRNLIELLEQEFKDKFKDKENVIDVVVAHYLRGIDGQLPGGKDSGNETTKNEKNRGQIERPEGDAQTDYLRRLAVEMARQANRTGKRVRAVGVLGDDYHDKLLVLKALRYTFPEAVFFTTDLDAAMLHPGDNRYTRNLLVASAFGLTLHPELQSGFPPFRTSYQTSSYLATVVALDEDLRDQRTFDKRQLAPLLFEIGRTAAVRLNNPREIADCVVDQNEKGVDQNDEKDRWKSCPDWQPARIITPHWRVIVGIGLALLAAILLAFLLSVPFQSFLVAHWLIAVAAVALVGAVAVGLIVTLPDPLGEPFSWIEGVSIWPSEFLFVLAILASILLLLYSLSRLQRSDERTDALFFLGSDNDPAPRERESRFQASEIWRLYRARQIGVRELDKRPTMREIESTPSGGLGQFLRQNLGAVFGFFLLSAGLMLAFGFPYGPARGNARLLDAGVLIAAILSFTLLLLYVLDASRRTVWLAGKLAGETSWPEAVLRNFALQKGEQQKFFDGWLDVRLLAAATEEVGRLVYYPFFVLFMMLFARSRLFDAWPVQLPLLLIFAVALVSMILCAWRLRQTAETARQSALAKMNDRLLEAQAKADGVLENQVKTMIDQVQTLSSGAFAPLSQQPLVRAILALASGISGVALLEYASMVNI
jgi:hypothetical protein